MGARLILVHDKGPPDPATAYAKLYADWMRDSMALYVATWSLPWVIWTQSRVG